MECQLTEEQKERIKRNKERALEIRRQRAKEKEQQGNERQLRLQADTTPICTGFEGIENNAETIALDQEKKETIVNISLVNSAVVVDSKDDENNKDDNDDNDVVDDDSELEDFEIGASTHISQTEATKIYCLPMGTLAICSYIEKPNPKQSKWSNMKLYCRKDIRRKARERFGGRQGLIEERMKREKKRSEKDLESGFDIFKSKKQKR